MKTFVSIALSSIALFAASASPGAQLRTDIISNLDTRSFADVVFNETGGTVAEELSVAAGSNLLIQAADATCTTQGCKAQLNYMRVTLGDFSLAVNFSAGSTGVGSASLLFHQPTITMLGPIPMTNLGAGFVVPVGTSVSFSATLSGTANLGGGAQAIAAQPAATLGALPTAMVIRYDVSTPQFLTVDGIFPFDFNVNGSIGGTAIAIDLPGSVAVLGSAVTPFFNSPPTAVAKAPKTAACGQLVTLDGSASTDANNNIQSFTWLASGGALLATGPKPSVALPPGQDIITLVVTDALGAQSTTTVSVTVSGACADGATCGNNGDCTSFVCTGGFCKPPSCAPTCNRGAPCGANSDCGAGICTAGKCQQPACSPKCADHAVCGDNSDCESFVCTNNVCGAPSCSPTCNHGAPCGANGDCGSQVCTGGLCQAPACSPKCGKESPCNNNGDCASFVCNNAKCN